MGRTFNTKPFAGSKYSLFWIFLDEHWKFYTFHFCSNLCLLPANCYGYNYWVMQIDMQRVTAFINANISTLIVLWLHIFYLIWYLCCQDFIIHKFFSYVYGWSISSAHGLIHFVQLSISEVTFRVLQIVKDQRFLTTANENYTS